MKKLIITTLLLLIAGLEITSRVGVKPIEFYNVPMVEGAIGAAFYPFVFYTGSEDIVKFNLNGNNTRTHELKHHAQTEEHGFLAYKISYAWYHSTLGYYSNPYEVEAYKAERHSH